MKISMTTITVAAALFAAPALVSAATIVGLTTGNRLVSFDSASPGVILADVAISGLALNHSLIGIDFRPADGVLVGVSRSSASDDAQVYTINTFTGGATAIGLLFALPGSSGFGVDFNPVPGALRLVTDAEANRRITMGGAGVVNTDASLNPVPTAGLQISGAAYSNNVPGGVGGNTTLYVVDSTSGNLYSQGSVNFPGGGRDQSEHRHSVSDR